MECRDGIGRGMLLDEFDEQRQYTSLDVAHRNMNRYCNLKLRKINEAAFRVLKTLISTSCLYRWHTRARGIPSSNSFVEENLSESQGVRVLERCARLTAELFRHLLFSEETATSKTTKHEGSPRWSACAVGSQIVFNDYITVWQHPK